MEFFHAGLKSVLTWPRFFIFHCLYGILHYKKVKKTTRPLFSDSATQRCIFPHKPTGAPEDKCIMNQHSLIHNSRASENNQVKENGSGMSDSDSTLLKLCRCDCMMLVDRTVIKLNIFIAF